MITVGNKQNIMTNKVCCPPVHPKVSRSIYTPLQSPSTLFWGMFHFQTRPNHWNRYFCFCLNQLISQFFLMLSWYYFNFKMKNNEKHQSIDLICSLIFKKVGSGLLPNSSTQTIVTIPQKKSSSSPPFERPNDTPATWSSSPPFRRRPPAAGLRPRPADPPAPPRRPWQCWRRCECGPSSWRATLW